MGKDATVVNYNNCYVVQVNPEMVSHLEIVETSFVGKYETGSHVGGVLESLPGLVFMLNCCARSACFFEMQRLVKVKGVLMSRWDLLTLQKMQLLHWMDWPDVGAWWVQNVG